MMDGDREAAGCGEGAEVEVGADQESNKTTKTDAACGSSGVGLGWDGEGGNAVEARDSSSVSVVDSRLECCGEVHRYV